MKIRLESAESGTKWSIMADGVMLGEFERLEDAAAAHQQLCTMPEDAIAEIVEEMKCRNMN